jgi:HK97 gp10 family phage protein
VVVGVGPDKDAWYGRFVEMGTGPAHAEPQQARALEMENDQYAASADRRGTPAQPFLRPAFDQNTDAAIEAMADELRVLLGL